MEKYSPEHLRMHLSHLNKKESTFEETKPQIPVVFTWFCLLNANDARFNMIQHLLHNKL